MVDYQRFILRKHISATYPKKNRVLLVPHEAAPLDWWGTTWRASALSILLGEHTDKQHQKISHISNNLKHNLTQPCKPARVLSSCFHFIVSLKCRDTFLLMIHKDQKVKVNVYVYIHLATYLYLYIRSILLLAFYSFHASAKYVKLLMIVQDALKTWSDGTRDGRSRWLTLQELTD